ncbi:Haemolytic domain-containing protein [Aliiroseovarius halocynthiae]|uniref:Membrane protein insertion efficiency factor YidD n=1 Tax=Aliiroseovarius halocynthiae TaxID=985055 RepID=A0A545SR50_9RHOB|nr:membrane protein insertion efficiency factor YidD [Aliiroseovarius halocynthiae]SMR81458.1 Haemolytic domain-containing protein [Aliiroseovarius halocynthiae]
MLSHAAIAGIAAYQRWISPYKGFRCAYAAVHGGPGCSGFAKHAIQTHGFWPALPRIQERFRDCRAAYETLQNVAASQCCCRAVDEKLTAGDEPEKKSQKRRCTDDACNGACAGADCFTCFSFL